MLVERRERGGDRERLDTNEFVELYIRSSREKEKEGDTRNRLLMVMMNEPCIR